MKRSYLKLVDVFLWSFVALFLLSAVIGKDIFQQLKHGLHLRILDLLIISIVLLLLRLYLLFRQRAYESRWFTIAPFCLLFLISVYRFSFVPEYRWGADDSFYYSYAASAIIDHDLNLTNQYERAGMMALMDEKFRERLTPTGLKENVFPVGCSILWTPFFLIGHSIAGALNAIGFSIPMDGYSRPYTHSVVVGNIFVVCAGLYFCYLFASRYFPKWISLISTLGLLCTTAPLFFFFNSFILVSEPPSMAIIALSLLLVALYGEKRNPLVWLFLGLLFGFSGTIRYHNLVFGLVPGVLLLTAALKKESRRQSIYALIAFAAGCVLAVLPQLFAWKIIYGSWLFNLPGAFLTWWKSPFVLETLFSSRKGLFPWTPIIVFSLWGLIVFRKKQPLWAWLFFAILLITVYINSAQRDWWGSVSVGPRRFLPCLIIFASGYAAFYDAIRKRWARIGHLLAVVVLVFFWMMTARLERSYARGIIPVDHAARFSDAFQNGFFSIYRYVVYPLELPVQLFYHFRCGIGLYHPLNEFFIGDDILYFQERAGNLLADRTTPLFGAGWKFENAGSRSTTASTAVLNLPMFFKEKEDLVMKMNTQAVGNERDAWIDFYLNGEFLRSKKVPLNGGWISVKLGKGKYRSAVNELELRLYRKRNENQSCRVRLSDLKFEPANDQDDNEEDS